MMFCTVMLGLRKAAAVDVSTYEPATTSCLGSKRESRETEKQQRHNTSQHKVMCWGFEGKQKRSGPDVSHSMSNTTIQKKLSVLSPWKQDVLKDAQTSIVDEYSINSSLNKSQFGGLGIRGQIKVDLKITDTTLTVHFKEVSHLQHQQPSCIAGFYAQIEIYPNNIRGESYRTRIINNNDEILHFDEQLATPISDKDRRRRLILSVHHADTGATVGSTSFGIKHLLYKSHHVTGCFYLLNDDLGRKKHLKVMTSCRGDIFRNTDIESIAETTEVSEISVINHCAAHGCVINTPGNITREQKKTGLFNESQTSMMYSSFSTTYMRQHITASTPAVTKSDRLHGNPDPVSSNGNNVSSVSQASKLGISTLSSIAPWKEEPRSKRNGRQHPTVCDSSFGSLKCQSYWGGCASTSVGDSIDTRGRFFHSQNQTLSETADKYPKRIEQDYWEIMADLKSRTTTNRTSCTSSSSLIDSTASITGEESTEYTQTSYDQMVRLRNLEEDFVQKMVYCTQKYSRPLRHCMITPYQHKTLFQNVEKLVAISDFHINRLMETLSRCRREPESGLGSVYLPQLSLMAEAYSVYCGGVQRAVSLLDDLMKNQEFRRFVCSPKCSEEGVSILEFLEKPVHHVMEIVMILQNILSDLPLHSKDHRNIEHVVESLSFVFKMCNHHPRDDIKISDGYVLRDSTSDSFCTDREVALLQKKLLFPRGCQPFQIVAPNRRVVHEEMVQYVEGWRWCEARLVLLTDTILLLTENQGKFIPIIHPVLLRDVADVDQQCDHAAEFVLTVEQDSSEDDDSATLQSLVLRCANVQSKSTLCHLIQEQTNEIRRETEYRL